MIDIIHGWKFFILLWLIKRLNCCVFADLNRDFSTSAEFVRTSHGIIWKQWRVSIWRGKSRLFKQIHARRIQRNECIISSTNNAGQMQRYLTRIWFNLTPMDLIAVAPCSLRVREIIVAIWSQHSSRSAHATTRFGKLRPSKSKNLHFRTNFTTFNSILSSRKSFATRNEYFVGNYTHRRVVN